MDECDVVVPRNRIAEFVKFVNMLEGKYEVRIRSFGNAGDGNLHVYVCRDNLQEDIWRKRLNKIMKERCMARHLNLKASFPVSMA